MHVRHIKSDVLIAAGPQLRIQGNLTLLALNESKLYIFEALDRAMAAMCSSSFVQEVTGPNRGEI